MGLFVCLTKPKLYAIINVSQSNAMTTFIVKETTQSKGEWEMALTRKLLESMGLESDKVSSIIEAHAETVEALKTQIATAKENADKLPGVQKELDRTKAELDSLKSNGGDWEKKYSQLNEDFENYKAEQTKKDLELTKKSAYRELLKISGVSDKRLDSILKVTNLDNIEIVDGKIKDAEALSESIKSEWADFIPQSETHGANLQNPPTNDASRKKYTRDDIAGMTPAEINKNWGDISASLKQI